MVDFCRPGHIRYRLNVLSHMLKIFVELRACVEQTYFSTLTAHILKWKQKPEYKVAPEYTIVETDIILLKNFFTSKFHFLS